MKKLYFVRHGECELKLLQVFAGQSDSPLTELGRDQAVLAGQDIISKGLKINKLFHFKVLYCRITDITLIVSRTRLVERLFHAEVTTPSPGRAGKEIHYG